LHIKTCGRIFDPSNNFQTRSPREEEDTMWADLFRNRGDGAMARRTMISGSTAVALLLVVVTVGAGTTGQLGGFVVDDQGSPLEGVSVTATSPAQIGQPQVTVTDNRGYFVYPRLAPGYYTVQLALDGFVSQELTEVQVRVDRVTEIRATMPLASFGDEILVAHTTPVVDPVQVSTGQTYTSDFITETSTPWLDLILQTAGVSPYNPLRNRVLGSTPQDNTYLLDGFDATNWYDRFPNLAASGVPFDAVQEVALHTAGFEAEFGQATGGVVNVVTRSGGNLFAGTVDVRYTDSGLEESGEHYDPDHQVSRLGRVSATLGGPILRDRLWFFATYGGTNYKNTPTGAPTTLESNQHAFLGKLTWQPSAAWSLVGKYSYAPGTLDDVGSSQFRAADATAAWENDPVIASLELVGVLSDSTLWSLRMGYRIWDHNEFPADGDLETIGHFNVTTREEYGNTRAQWYGESSQTEIASDFTCFSSGFLGSHEIKAGLGYGAPTGIDDRCLNGGGRCVAGVEGYFFRDITIEPLGTLPWEMLIERAEGPLDIEGTSYVAYVQDVWRLPPNLTLKLGLRWDRVAYSNNTGEIADLSKIQPRIGVAWDLSGDGRSILRASWGRFMHPGTLNVASLTSATNYPRESWISCSLAAMTEGFDPGLCPVIAGMNGWGWRTDPESWDPAGWFLDPANIIFEEPHRIADDLTAGYVDEWIIGFERELFRRTSLELSYVNKRSEDLFDDTCSGNIPEPGSEPGCDYLVVANLPEARLDYEAWMLRFETRALDRLHLLASWVISDSKGSMEVNTANANSFDVYPYHFVNRYGYLGNQSRHRLKLSGYMLFPYGFSMAVNGWWDSEYRWTPLDLQVPGMPWGELFLEPRGSRDAGVYHQLDLQLGKSLDVGPVRLELLARVINVLDSECTWDVCANVTGCGEDFELGDTILWQQPRHYEIGFRVEF
jgi:hypothetical protein